MCFGAAVPLYPVEIPRHGLGERAFRLGAGVHRPPLPRREPVPSAGHGAHLGLHALQRMAGGDEAEPHESRASVPQRGCKRLLDTAERFGIGATPRHRKTAVQQHHGADELRSRRTTVPQDHGAAAPRCYSPRAPKHYGAAEPRFRKTTVQ